MNLNECIGLGLCRVCQVNEKTNGASPYQWCLSIVAIYLLTDTDVPTNYRVLAIKDEVFGRRALHCIFIVVTVCFSGGSHTACTYIT